MDSRTFHRFNLANLIPNRQQRGHASPRPWRSCSRPMMIRRPTPRSSARHCAGPASQIELPHCTPNSPSFDFWTFETDKGVVDVRVRSPDQQKIAGFSIPATGALPYSRRPIRNECADELFTSTSACGAKQKFNLRHRSLQRVALTLAASHAVLRAPGRKPPGFSCPPFARTKQNDSSLPNP